MFILINASLVLVFLYINWHIRFLFFTPDNPPLMMPPPGFGRFHQEPSMTFIIYKDVISYSIPVVFSVAVKSSQRWIKTEAAQKEAEKERLKSELLHLRYQLQPHFFFNSLNNIYALVDLKPELAKESIHTLSKLMRYMLYDSDIEEVSLNKEIQFMENYIYLMKIRTNDKVTISYDFPAQDSASEIRIAPLLFISLIENAFKHGVSLQNKSNIYFKLSAKDSKLEFISVNTNFPKADNDKSGSGIGLENLTKRLDLLYPERYSFTQSVNDGLYHAQLEIDLNQ
jgi:LytS/YehU family sensor histidine kinase